MAISAGGHVSPYKAAWLGSTIVDRDTLSTPVTAIAAGPGRGYALVTIDNAGYAHHGPRPHAIRAPERRRGGLGSLAGISIGDA